MLFLPLPLIYLFFFNDTATTEIYTLSLHDALPISQRVRVRGHGADRRRAPGGAVAGDRKSTRLNSSHTLISYAVFFLKNKKLRGHPRRRSRGANRRRSDVEPVSTV